MKRLGTLALMLACAVISAQLAPLSAKDPDQIAADAARAAERAAEQAARASVEADRADSRLREERARADAEGADRAARAEADRVKDQARSAEDAARAAARTQEDALKAQEDAAKAAEDAAQEQAKAAEDAAKEQAKAAEDAAKDAADAAEDAAEADNSGSSDAMHDLAAQEKPEFDSRGFPARRGEIVGLDVPEAARIAALREGFRVIAENRLPALDAKLLRLAIPKGMSASAALVRMREIDSKSAYDLTHYYGLNIGTAGASDGTARQPVITRKGNLRIGMIDTAIAPHPLLRGVSVEARGFIAKGQKSDATHGTAIASLLAMAGSSRIVAANVFQGSGTASFTSADAVAQGLEWLLARKVNVINISLAGPSNAILDVLVRRAARNGHAIVAAAGNGGPAAPPAYPAAVPGVVAVTAVDANLHIYRYANQGRYIAFAARGVGVTAAAPDGTVSGYSGTSFASPLIAAHLARCAGAKAGDIDQCVHGMERRARDLGAPGKDTVYGHGFISE